MHLPATGSNSVPSVPRIIVPMAMITLNTAVAYQLKEFKADIDKLIAEGHTKENAIFTVLKRYTGCMQTDSVRGEWI